MTSAVSTPKTTPNPTPNTDKGSNVVLPVTETALVSDSAGMFTARLRAPREEFEKVLPAYREFLLQLVLGPAEPAAPSSERGLP